MSNAAKIRDFDDPSYDPYLIDALAFGTHENPYPRFAEMRAKAAVHETGFRTAMGLPDAIFGKRRAYCVIGYDEVSKVLVDPVTYSNKAYAENLGLSFGKTMTAMDPPEHTPWRRIFQKIFLPQYVREWGSTIVDPVVEGLIARFRSRGTADLVGEFTHLYPFEVIYHQLDLPRSDIATFQRLAVGQSDFLDTSKAVEAGDKLGEYFRSLVAQRRANPGGDLVTLLATTEAEGEYLPEDVLISFLRQLMNAAGDTTYRGTSVLLTALLTNPGQLDDIRQDRDLIPQAIEESLRWDGPVGVQMRAATRDVTLGGVDIPAGSLVYVIAAAANRDPAIWPDPDSFDIHRAKKPHFSFARGPHMCVGQHLARIEMTRALIALLDNLPELRLDRDMPPPQLRGSFMRVPEHIHVRFAPQN